MRMYWRAARYFMGGAFAASGMAAIAVSAVHGFAWPSLSLYPIEARAILLVFALALGAENAFRAVSSPDAEGD